MNEKKNLFVKIGSNKLEENASIQAGNVMPFEMDFNSYRSVESELARDYAFGVMETIFFEHGKYDPWLTGKWEFLKQATQIFCALTALNYVIVAKGYHHHIFYGGDILHGEWAVFIASVAVLWISTQFFFQMQFHKNRVQNAHASEQNEDNAPSCCTKYFTKDIIATIIFSYLSSAVLAVTIMDYQTDLNSVLAILLMVKSFIDNGVLHLLPFMLILSSWWWSFPFSMLGSTFSWFKLSTGEWERRKMEQDWNGRCEALNNKRIGRIRSIVQALEKSSAEYNCRRLCYDIKVPKIVETLALNHYDKNVWVEFFNHIPHQGEKHQDAPSKLRQCGSGLFQFMFCIWVWGSASGYIANSVNIAAKLVNNNYFLAALICTLPVYALSILLIFFGQSIGNTMFNFIFNCKADKIPFEAKLYLRTFLLLAVPILLYVLLYSYWAADEIFMDSVNFLPTLTKEIVSDVVVILGITWLDVKATLDLLLYLTEVFGIRFASKNNPQHKWLAFKERVDLFIADLDSMTPEALLKEVKGYGHPEANADLKPNNASNIANAYCKLLFGKTQAQASKSIERPKELDGVDRGMNRIAWICNFFKGGCSSTSTSKDHSNEKISGQTRLMDNNDDSVLEYGS